MSTLILAQSLTVDGASTPPNALSGIPGLTTLRQIVIDARFLDAARDVADLTTPSAGKTC